MWHYNRGVWVITRMQSFTVELFFGQNRRDKAWTLCYKGKPVPQAGTAPLAAQMREKAYTYLDARVELTDYAPLEPGMRKSYY